MTIGQVEKKTGKRITFEWFAYRRSDGRPYVNKRVVLTLRQFNELREKMLANMSAADRARVVAEAV